MKILAFSDLHGRNYKKASQLIKLLKPDWIVLLGDILPDFDMVSGVANRLACQRNHWNEFGHLFESPNAPTTFIRGNHELDGFEVPKRHQMLPGGMEGQVLQLEGYPSDSEAGVEGRCLSLEGLSKEVQDQADQNPGAGVVLSHVPPFGCLDEAEPGQTIGHKPLADWLFRRRIGPRGLVLCGHVHESFGIGSIGDNPNDKALVVNLAGGFALVQTSDEGWRVNRMARLDDIRIMHRDSPIDEL